MKTEKEKVIKESEIMSFIEYALKRERDAGKSEAIKQVMEIYEKLYRENDEVPPEMLKSKIGELAK